MSLPAATHMGAVRLRVRDQDEVLTFYRDALGLRVQNRAGADVELAASDGTPLIRLTHDPAAVARPPRTTGLYHLALLFPDRRSLGAAVRDLAAADVMFHGFADHLVSEAAYLADPADNGIELYRDRPRSEWQMRETTILMATELLDVPALLAEADLSPAPPGRVPDLRIGHVHLHVASNARAAAFYTQVIGFEVTNRDYPGAIFLSAGGYHHHLAVNEWGSRQPRPPGTTGLIEFEIVVPDTSAVEEVAARAHSSELQQGVLRLQDPDGHGIVIRAAS